MTEILNALQKNDFTLKRNNIFSLQANGKNRCSLHTSEIPLWVTEKQHNPFVYHREITESFFTMQISKDSPLRVKQKRYILSS